MKKWTKKLGEIHISGENGETLCGIPMLGNNYIDCYKELDKMVGRDRKACQECLAKTEKSDRSEGVM